jgi:nucleoside-diphosphate-sugar epimerase
MKLLVTGAAGFIGGHTAEAFLQKGHSVVGLVRAQSRADLLKSLGVTLCTASLSNSADLQKAMAGVDVVVHTVAKVDPYGPWHEFVDTTVRGTQNILQAAINAGVSRFVHISSVGVYERPARPGILYEETCPFGTPYHWSYYARAKIAAEKLVQDAHEQKRIATTILRPTWVYGPRDTKIFGRVVSSLRTQNARWIGDGDNLLNLVYISDVANAIVLSATNPKAGGQTYNIADDENSVSQRQYLTKICERLDLPVPRSSLSYPAAHNLGFLCECIAHMTRFKIQPPITRLSALLLGGRRRFSNQKLREELGWHPIVRSEEGIERTIEWFRSTQA